MFINVSSAVAAFSFVTTLLLFVRKNDSEPDFYECGDMVVFRARLSFGLLPSIVKGAGG